MIRKNLVCAVMMLAATASINAEAAPVYSWNLSRDMMGDFSTNPFGLGKVWAAMYDVNTKSIASHNPSNYQLLPHHPLYINIPLESWEHTEIAIQRISIAKKTFTSNGYVAIKGIPLIYPSSTYPSLIRWTSPINGKVNIMGKIADADAGCGNGVSWFVDKGNFTLMSGTLSDGKQASILQQNVPVSVGTNLYFIVFANGDGFCDDTFLDLVITNS